MADRRVLIMGAAGRDFHVFNTVFREDPRSEVVGFTATQIPGIADRRYPPALAGPTYPEGIPIFPEDGLESLIAEHRVNEVVFAYSDVSHETVMHQASRALAAGADFRLLGPDSTMVRAAVPVVSVCAVRTGAGKSQTSRFAVAYLQRAGRHPVVIRHPMPYGDLERQRVQRFETLEDLTTHQATVEEREDYEPHVRRGTVVYAGVDYEAVVRAAEREADVIVWDGGNNDFSFVRPDLEIVVVDPLRPGHESRFHPGEVNARRAEIIIVNKVDSAAPGAVAAVRESLRRMNPRAIVVEVGSEVSTDWTGGSLEGRRVLVVEDGPTVTHGGMSEGAGMEAARRLGATQVVDPRPFAVGSLAAAFETYPHLGPVLPALGYYPDQLRDLASTIAAVGAEIVISASPFDLAAVVSVAAPVIRVSYELAERGEPSLSTALERFVADLPVITPAG